MGRERGGGGGGECQTDSDEILLRQVLNEHNTAQDSATMESIGRVESCTNIKSERRDETMKSTRFSSVARKVPHDGGKKTKGFFSFSPPAADGFCSWSDVLSASCGMT